MLVTGGPAGKGPDPPEPPPVDQDDSSQYTRYPPQDSLLIHTLSILSLSIPFIPHLLYDYDDERKHLSLTHHHHLLLIISSHHHHHHHHLLITSSHHPAALWTNQRATKPTAKQKWPLRRCKRLKHCETHVSSLMQVRAPSQIYSPVKYIPTQYPVKYIPHSIYQSNIHPNQISNSLLQFDWSIFLSR